MASRLPTGPRAWVPGVLALVAVGVGAAALAQRPVNVWLLAVASVVLVGVLEPLLAWRPSYIAVDGDSLVVRSHLGLTDRRPLGDLLTVEWHSDGWRRSIVLNFVQFGDNLRISASGYDVEELGRFSAGIGRPFLGPGSLPSATGAPPPAGRTEED